MAAHSMIQRATSFLHQNTISTSLRLRDGSKFTSLQRSRGISQTLTQHVLRKRNSISCDEVHPVHGDLGVFIRGKIDWVIDLEGDVARLADLKTASTHWMGQWSDTKASSQLQATAYGYAIGKPLDFSYVVIPKADAKSAPSTKVEHYRTQRGETHYAGLEDPMWNFIQQTDVLNNYANFVPYANPDPSKYSHCNKLCDYKGCVQERVLFVIVMLFWDEWMGFDWMAFRSSCSHWVASVR